MEGRSTHGQPHNANANASSTSGSEANEKDLVMGIWSCGRLRNDVAARDVSKGSSGGIMAGVGCRSGEEEGSSKASWLHAFDAAYV